MDNQSISLSPLGANGIHFFINLILSIIIVYLLVLVLNFLRDKYLNKEQTSTKPEIHLLFTILNKLCFFSGWGFICANIVQTIFVKVSESGQSRLSINLSSNWNYLAFGVILIFIGIAFKQINKVVFKKKELDF